MELGFFDKAIARGANSGFTVVALGHVKKLQNAFRWDAGGDSSSPALPGKSPDVKRRGDRFRIFVTSVLLMPFVALAASDSAGLALKEVYQKDFLVGVALNRNQFSGQDQRALPLIKAQFNSITSENALKWDRVHRSPGQYDFAAADRYVAFGQTNHMAIIGHTLVWHSGTPAWVFQNEHGTPDRDALLRRMRDHIHTVVGRYRGQIKGWDVVNEALAEDGTLRPSPWLKIIGEDYIAKAFEYAHEADPKAELYYNDYSLENEPKREGAIALVNKLQALRIPIAGIGVQSHFKMDWPTPAQEDAMVAALSKLGVKVMITELDVDVVPATQDERTADIELKGHAPAGADIYAQGLPTDAQAALAKRYAEMFAIFVKHRGVIDRVTFWGATDGDSWLNAPHRTNHPLLFDRNGEKKLAFEAVIKASTP